MKRWRRKVMIAAAVMLAGSLPQAATAEESQTAETEEVSSMVTVQQLGLEDGTYIADGTLEGGSGRATISSPVELTVKDGQMTARIEFSSPYYDYMIVDGEKYEPENTEGNSQFTIPMAGFDAGVPVTADTVAMSVVEEVIAARHVGMRVLGLSLVSNKACGIEGADPNSDEVMDVAEKVKPEFTALMNGFLCELARLQ